MNNRKCLEGLDREQCLDLLEIYAKNWLAMDGVWFQSIESKEGMDSAMYHDGEAWRRFTVIEAKRIKAFLHLPEQPGLEGLAKALPYRFYGCLNEFDISFKDRNTLIFKNIACRVQTARRRKGMELHPCRPVGLIEHEGFARTIDPRIRCRCLSCYPEITDPEVCCSWEFSIPEDQNHGETE